MYVIHCWVEHPIRSLDQTFSYMHDAPIEKGVRVVLNFHNQHLVGFVHQSVFYAGSMADYKQEFGYALKPIEDILDEEPLITNELEELALYMKGATLATTISCYQAMLPGKIKPMANKHTVAMVDYVKVSGLECTLTPKQAEAYQYVLDHKEVLYKDLRKKYPNQANQLVKMQALIRYQKEKEASEFVDCKQGATLPFTPLQQKVYDDILMSDDLVYLLRGVTGSGKTEVYLQLASHAIKQGKQVLILVPEIALTPQMIDRVSKRFTSGLAIYHSGLNAQEKYEQYKLVKQGKAKIVVGTRSSVFLPFQNLGFIVMDEEHDSSYKQDVQPSYHCRDIAIWRSKYHNCKLLLGSATPTLESYARALKGVYHLEIMDQRINPIQVHVSVVDLKEAMKNRESYMITKNLYDKMYFALERKEQVILLLNRRGYHARFRCNVCKETLLCPHCDLAMSYHQNENMLKCHTCGTTMQVPLICPSCKQKTTFATYGFGTQRLMEEAQQLFPNAKLLRMDADTTTKKNAHKKMLTAFGNHEADILVGTQMIAKGLDFPDVTLVGIVNGDEGLARSDFRSCEDTFDLLMQASGRSGRKDKQGEVVLQVFDPSHYAIQCAASGDYDRFFQQEMEFRKMGLYPPYTFLIAITFASRKEDEASHLAIAFKNQLQGNFKVLGVITLLKIKDQYRSRILLKGKDLEEMKQAVLQVLQSDTSLKTKDIRIDVNPMTLL